MKFSKYLFITVLLLEAVTAAPAQEFFEPVPFPGGGITTSMVRDSAGVLYAAVPEHGIYRSFENGDSWECSLQMNGRVYPPFVFPDGAVWAADFDWAYWVTAWNVTTDHGASWHPAEETGRSYIDLRDGVFRSSGSSVLSFSEDESCIFISRDCGRSWDSLDLSGPLYDVCILSDSEFIVAAYARILHTTDAGLHWTVALEDSSRYFTEINHLGDSLYTYGYPRRSDEGGRLFITDRSVSMWTVRPGSSAICRAIRHADKLWCLSERLYPSNWTEPFEFGTISDAGALTPTQLGDIHAYAGIPHPDGGMLFATDAGILHHDALKNTWSQRNTGLPPRQIHALLETAKGDLLAGTAFGGLYRRVAGSHDWIRAGLFPDPVSVLTTLPDGRVAAGGTVIRPYPSGLGSLQREGPLHVGTLDETSWIRRDTLWNGLHDMVIGDDGIVHACTKNEVMRSKDDLQTIDSVYEYGPKGFDTADEYSTIERFDNNYLIAVLSWAYLESNNAGESWREFTRWPYLKSVRRISQSCILRYQRGYLIRSLDNGLTWEILPTQKMHYGRLLSAGRGTALLGNNREGAWTECWVITANGDSLQHLMLDPDTYGIVNCALHASDGYLYIGTSRGLFRSRRRMGESAQVHGFNLGQHYPNPASGNITIPFEIRRQGRMRLSIHETTGREAWVVEDGWHAAGRYESVVPVNRLRAGVYFIRLEQGGEVMIRKLVVDGSSRAGAPTR